MLLVCLSANGMQWSETEHTGNMIYGYFTFFARKILLEKLCDYHCCDLFSKAIVKVQTMQTF